MNEDIIDWFASKLTEDKTDKTFEIVQKDYEKANQSAFHYDNLVWTTITIFIGAVFVAIAFFSNADINLISEEPFIAILISVLGILLLAVMLLFTQDFRLLKKKCFDQAKGWEKVFKKYLQNNLSNKGQKISNESIKDFEFVDSFVLGGHKRSYQTWILFAFSFLLMLALTVIAYVLTKEILVLFILGFISFGIIMFFFLNDLAKRIEKLEEKEKNKQ